MNLKQYLSSANCSESLSKLICDIAGGAEMIMSEVKSEDVGAVLSTSNSSGDKQMALDVRTDSILKEILVRNGGVSSFCSEETEEVVNLQKDGFFVVFDPLDGSSLLDVNFSIGTIVGIYDCNSLIGKTGDDQVASMFFVYGPRLTMVLTVRNGAHEFIYIDGDFRLSNANLTLNKPNKMFAPGNLRAVSSNERYGRLVEYWIKNGYTLRYSGGMVPDVNQILLKGCGIFTYPGYGESPNGKLRLLYECAPIALLIEQAGGLASDGLIRLLDKPIESMHQTTPVFLGKDSEVAKALEFFA